MEARRKVIRKDGKRKEIRKDKGKRKKRVGKLQKTKTFEGGRGDIIKRREENERKIECGRDGCKKKRLKKRKKTWKNMKVTK